MKIYVEFKRGEPVYRIVRYTPAGPEEVELVDPGTIAPHGIKARGKSAFDAIGKYRDSHRDNIKKITVIMEE